VTPQEEWPDGEGRREVEEDFWEKGEGGDVGDRRQEIALLGLKGRGREGGKARVVRDLEACLVREEEWKEGGREGWKGWVDPFPEW
jgi:hypothetical protein